MAKIKPRPLHDPNLIFKKAPKPEASPPPELTPSMVSRLEAEQARGRAALEKHVGKPLPPVEPNLNTVIPVEHRVPSFKEKGPTILG